MEELVVVEKQAFVNFVSCLNTAVGELKNENIILENYKLKTKVSK